VALPTLLAGELPDATKWADILSYLPVASTKGSDQSVTNSTTLTNDNALSVAYVSGRTYRVELMWIFTASTTADAKFALTFSSASLAFGTQRADTALAYLPDGFTTYTSGTAITTGGNGVSNGRMMLLIGELIASGNGTLQLQFAQSTAVPAESATSKSGSHLILTRIA
jgi:hypothetical protein